MPKLRHLVPILLTATACAQAPTDLVIQHATIMTASHGTIPNGSVWVHAGKIAAVGLTVDAPATATIVNIPRQSRGLYFVSRSKRLRGSLTRPRFG